MDTIRNLIAENRLAVFGASACMVFCVAMPIFWAILGRFVLGALRGDSPDQPE